MSLFISRTFRQRLWPDQEAVLPAGKVPVGEATQARGLVDQMAGEGLQSGEVAALSLLDDAYQAVLGHHLGRRDPTLTGRVLAVLRAQLGIELLDRLLVEFAEEYLGAHLSGLLLLVDGSPQGRGDDLDRSRILQQMWGFWLLHSNPAAQAIVAKLHAAPLLQVPAFRDAAELSSEILEREPGYEPEDSSLWELLVRPQRLSPDSLADQLSHLKRIWPSQLGELTDRMDAILGMLSEEEAPRFPPGPGPSEIPRYDATAEEVRFSDDRSWMSSLVMVAKHILVWLHQLSAEYDRRIERLDQVPNEALEHLATLGFNGLWMIGLWQRSPASQRIKDLCGNPEAAASAYSLTKYVIADELGGEDALEDLRRRAAGYGIRVAADMVPNHTGLDSDWMVEHPDWFIGQRECPFPSYRFEGPDLSSRPEVGVYLDDHYYDRSDAAVVFKRVDRHSGDERFIYHGNDGTSMPWNDTAQLDYLNREVWEAVVDTIVGVARRFPIIRFDAAMTLTRRHYQRLWYPAPGTAGDIPSRAEHGMSEELFREAMPEEFWRLVVDRLAAEAPNTLLLAEAFWLMEGYFVRTLGMHRVYNSAFMNMLRDGETEKFRRLIKETLIFDPEILKRYVNFMSNPDELSAIEQFGDGDRYFGTCALMSTLPGLPMYGHGQVEGLAERYGMEYRQSYWDESPRGDLVDRHRRQIAPLLQRREIFADVEHFRLFDLIATGGEVEECVLAYCNGAGDARSLVLFNNCGHGVHGRLELSAPFGENLSTTAIGEALEIDGSDVWTCHDELSGNRFLLGPSEVAENGLEIALGPWESRVLTGFGLLELERELAARMLQRVGCHGVASLAAVQREIELEPLRLAFTAAMDENLLQRLMKLPGGVTQLGEEDALLEELRSKVGELAGSVLQADSGPTARLLALVTLPELARRLAASRKAPHRKAGLGLQGALERRPEVLPTLFCWLLLTTVTDAAPEAAISDPASDWHLESSVLDALVAAGGEPETVGRLISVLGQALRVRWGREARSAPEPMDFQRQLLADEKLRQTLGAHQFEGREYISKEALESVIDWRLLLEAQAWSASSGPAARVPGEVSQWWRALHQLATDAEESSYRTDELGIVDAAAVTPAAS